MMLNKCVKGKALQGSYGLLCVVTAHDQILNFLEYLITTHAMSVSYTAVLLHLVPGSYDYILILIPATSVNIIAATLWPPTLFDFRHTKWCFRM